MSPRHTPTAAAPARERRPSPFRAEAGGHGRRMSEPEGTGYRDSPDTTDGTAPAPDDAAEGSATLTTDDEAQRDDGVARPGNESD